MSAVDVTALYRVGQENQALEKQLQQTRKMETKMLQGLGYEVSACTDSTQAFKRFQAAPEKYDLVISDVAMPRMGGDALVLKILDVRPDIPILLCTGYSGTVTETKATEMGIRGLLIKPVAMADLARIIRDIFD